MRTGSLKRRFKLAVKSLLIWRSRSQKAPSRSTIRRRSTATAAPDTGSECNPSGENNAATRSVSPGPVLLDVDAGTVGDSSGALGNPNPLSTTADEAEPSASPASPKSQKGGVGLRAKLTTGYLAIRNLLVVVERASEVFPPLKGAVGCINALLEANDAFRDNQEEFEKLAERVRLLDEILKGRSDADIPQEVKDRRDGLTSSIKSLAARLEEKTHRSGVKRAAYTAEDKREIVSLVREMTFSIELAMLDVTMQSDKMILKAVAGVDWLKERMIEEFQKIGGDVSGIAKGVAMLNRAEMLKRLGEVRHSSFSRGGRRKGCVPGSRIALLSQLLTWSQDEASHHAFWLSGMAGEGKTTISETFCLELSKRGMLGASFFCSPTAHGLSDIYHVIPTLSKSLAKLRPEFADALANVLDELGEDVDPLEMKLEEQYAHLVLRPAEIAFHPTQQPIILCIDALDECRDTRGLSDLLDALVLTPPPPGLKVFLTSRPEHAIRERMESPQFSQHLQVLRLQDIDPDVVRRDIALYVHRELENIPVLRKYCGSEAWPPPQAQTIVARSGIWFFIAATILRYIDDESGNRIERFMSCGSPDNPLDLPGMDALYRGILDRAFAELSPQEAEDMRACLSQLVSTQRPLEVEEYATLINRPEWAVREALRPLCSVIDVEKCRPDCVYHASFISFLTASYSSICGTPPPRTLGSDVFGETK